jgi:glutamine amidotransferase
MNVVVIRYGAGNIQSVLFALERIGVTPTLSSDPEVIAKADKVIFPGVGEASSTMKELKASGLDKTIKSLKQPILGICLGMQLMCKHSEEGDVDCLDIFDLEVKKLQPSTDLKVPHVGWDAVCNMQGHLFKGCKETEFMYYVHSYYAVPKPGNEVCGITSYITTITAAIMKDNFYAVQFHPEKSGARGELILKNFIEL